jgi:hypothetical protein
MIQVTDEELFLRLQGTEDNFVERKRFSDDRQWNRTAVAFANSCPIDFPGILFIGVYDNGMIERSKDPVNLDSLQKTLAQRIADAWPPIYFLPKVLHRDGVEFLAVLIPGSPLRPHFAGHSYVRIGSETRKASEEQFNALIVQRNSKAREIQQMIGELISWEMIGKTGNTLGSAQGKVVECNQFYMTVDGGTYKRSFPLEWVVISFDPGNIRHHLMVNYP